jgi:hypothetical protein
MAIMPVEDKQSIRPSCWRLCVSVEVLYLFKTKLIFCLSIVTKRDHPVRQEVLILASLVKLSFQGHKVWKTPTRSINTLNCCHPLSIT